MVECINARRNAIDNDVISIPHKCTIKGVTVRVGVCGYTVSWERIGTKATC